MADLPLFDDPLMDEHASDAMYTPKPPRLPQLPSQHAQLSNIDLSTQVAAFPPTPKSLVEGSQGAASTHEPLPKRVKFVD